MTELDDKGAAPRGPAQLRLAWRTVALAAAVASTAAVASLIVVATVQEAGALSTVALSLAIVSFVIQVLVFMVDSTARSEQTQRSEALYTETEGLLREVRATAQATQDFLATQFATVLRHALRELPGDKGDDEASVPGEAKDLLLDSSLLVDQFKEVLDDALTERLQTASPATRTRKKADAEKLEWLRSYPTEEQLLELLPTFRALSPLAVTMLSRYAANLEESARNGQRLGLRQNNTNSPARRELTDAGVLETLAGGSEVPMGRLTDLGERLARLLTARGEPPDYFVRELGPT
jgi:hypothetical protein